MKLIILLVIGIFMIGLSHAQTIPVNQKDSAGRKNGRWIWYYDRYCSLVKDSSKATYYCYANYLHGRRFSTISAWGDKKWKLVDSVATAQRGKLKLLDGKYTWYSETGKPMVEHLYKNGELVYRKWYYANGNLRVLMDYRKPYEGQPHSGELYEYTEDGRLKSSVPIYIYKDKNGKYYGGVI